MESIFHCAGSEPHVLARHYQKVVSREFFDGELGTASDGPINLFLEKGLDNPISLVHLCTPNRITYRRSQRHIQLNHTDVYMAWRIRRGGLKFARSSGTVTAREDEIIIYDSATPFYSELVCDERGVHDSLQAILPAHLFRPYLGDLTECCAVIDVKGGHGYVADHIMSLLGGQGHALSRDLASSLSTGLMQALGECLTGKSADKSRRSIADRRLDEVHAFITRNLTNRDLSINLIAEACKISPRYLCYLLKAAGYTFSQLVWDKRLDTAKSWLLAPKMQSYLVHEIAHMVGYTSAAHFSRNFKIACGCTPTEYRRRMLDHALEAVPSEEMH